tara:strand:+ start:703 stop:2370 length:1668 start_codon:yes stop_codon:yes gene_type:complete
MSQKELDAAMLELAKREQQKRLAASGGAVNTFGGYAKDISGATLAGLARGGIGAAELPEMAGRGILRLGQEGLQALGFDAGQDIPVLDTSTGQALRGGVEQMGLGDELQYRGQTMPAKFAGAIGEFGAGAGAFGLLGKGMKLAGGASKLGKTGEYLAKAGLTKEAQAASALSAVGSEAAGQATEGTAFEPAARIAAAIATPTAMARSFNLLAKPYDAWIKPRQIMNEVKTGNTAVDLTLARAISKPSKETQQAFKTTAYREADKVGDVFGAGDIRALAEGSRAKLFQGSDAMAAFDPRGDKHIVKALNILDEYSDAKSTLMNVDDMRGQVRAVYRSGLEGGAKKFDPRIKSIIDDIDDMIKQKAAGSELLNAARLGFIRTKKLEILEDALEGADRDIKAGASATKRYQTAIKRVAQSKKSKSYFDENEVAAMDRILEGSLDDKVLRQFGKLSPQNSFSLMSLISNLGIGAAIVTGSSPYLIGVSAAAFVAKPLSEAMIKSQIKELNRFLATGVAPTKFKPPMIPRVAGIAPQLQQDSGQQAGPLRIELTNPMNGN